MTTEISVMYGSEKVKWIAPQAAVTHLAGRPAVFLDSQFSC